VRAGTLELNWNIGLGAIWLYVLQGSINGRCPGHGDNFLQSTYNAIMEVAEWSVKDLYSIPNVHYKDIHVDGTGTSVISGRVAGTATFENVDARNVGAVGVNNCGRSTSHPRVGVLALRERQRRRRDHGSVVRAVGTPKHDHVRRPSSGRRASAASAW